MKIVDIEEARRRIAVKRHQNAQDRAGAWIGRDPRLADICKRLIEFDPIIGDEISDPEGRARALGAAVEQGIATVAEVNLLSAAILRARELYPDD